MSVVFIQYSIIITPSAALVPLIQGDNIIVLYMFLFCRSVFLQLLHCFRGGGRKAGGVRFIVLPTSFQKISYLIQHTIQIVIQVFILKSQSSNATFFKQKRLTLSVVISTI